METPTGKARIGHKKRLKDSFIAGMASSYNEAALLELLLSYAVPHRDGQQLSEQLLDQYGSLSGVLGADMESLGKFMGINSYPVALLKLVDWIRKHYTEKKKEKIQDRDHLQVEQTTLFERQPEGGRARPANRIHGKGLFARAVLREAIELLPYMPETESLTEVRGFLKNNLHFNSEKTLDRFTYYIIRRMFPEGYADSTLRVFAKKYKGRKELGDVCFYRFCKKEPLMIDIINEIMVPSIREEFIERSVLKDYLTSCLPSSKSIGDYAHAIVEAMVSGGIAQADKKKITFSYRDILLPSFAFIVHSEFPDPGTYELAQIKEDPLIRMMLWQPDQLVPALHKLSGRGLLSPVSETDGVRQFSTKWTLKKVVNQLVSEEEGLP